MLVGHEPLVELGVGQPAFEAAQGFLAGLAFGQLSGWSACPAVGWRIWTIAARYRAWFSRRFRPGQPMGDDLAAGGLDRGGAGVGSEVMLGREPADVTDLAQQLGGQNRADPEQLGEGRRRKLVTACLEAIAHGRDPPVQGADVGDEVGGELSAGTGRRRLWPHAA